MDTTRQELRQELLMILGQAMAAAVDLHEQQETTGLDPMQRAGQILPLLGRTADKIEDWTRPRQANP